MEPWLPMKHKESLNVLVMFGSTSWMVTRLGIRLEATLRERLLMMDLDGGSFFLALERLLPLEHPQIIIPKLCADSSG